MGGNKERGSRSPWTLFTSVSVISFGPHRPLIPPSTVLWVDDKLIGGSIKPWAIIGQRPLLLLESRFSESIRDGEGRKPGGPLESHWVSSEHNKSRIAFSEPKFLRVLRRSKVGLAANVTDIYHLDYLYLKDVVNIFKNLVSQSFCEMVSCQFLF